jgi:D-alanyl-D-alanine carboxypeptidase (penicillin-binding protein 5/6)
MKNNKNPRKIKETGARFCGRNPANLSAAVCMILTAVIFLCPFSSAWKVWGVTKTKTPPSIEAESAIIYCKDTGEIIYEKKSGKSLSPYDINKLMTAFLAADKLSMTDEVTVSAEAVSKGGSALPLKEGEKVSVKDLIYLTLLMSADDASFALAEAVSGNVDDFVSLMNKTADNIGCKNTVFSTPSGNINDVSSNATTSKDLLILCKIIFSDDVMREIGGTKDYDMPATNKNPARHIVNTFPFIASGDPGFLNGKAGYWKKDAAALALSYKEDGGPEFIAIFMGAKPESVKKDVKSLIAYAESSIKGIKAIKKGNIVGKVRVRHGEETRVDVKTASDCTVYLPKAGSEDLIKTTPDLKTDLEAPIKKGDKVGEFRVYVAGEPVNAVDLIAAKDVKTGWIPSYIGISNRASLIIMVVVGLVVALIIIRIINKGRNRYRKRKRHKQRVKEAALEALRNEENGRHF